MQMKSYILVIILSTVLFGSIFVPDNSRPQVNKITAHELIQIHTPLMDSVSPVYFFTATRCYQCHGPDTNRKAMVTELGEDVNILDDWAGSIMANGVRDPYWQAKVQQELNIHADNPDVVHNLCLNCHAPMGKYQKFHASGELLRFQDILNDTLAMDGISCMACHTMQDTGLFEHNGGFIHFNTDSTIYGPFHDPKGVTMTLYTGLQPIYGAHIKSSALCGKCHGLVVDIPGRELGFVEQATYMEWSNSNYDERNIQCQDCHMPVAESPVIIASGVSDLDYRDPFYQHQFAGANSLILQMLRDNRDLLNVKASVANFDSSLKYNLTLLRNQTLDIDLKQENNNNDSLLFSVHLKNKAGHKLPTGYPARRVILQFAFINELNGDTLFQSGALTPDGHLVYKDSDFQPHFEKITSPYDAQIYQAFMADASGNATTTLAYGDHFLKDNRLVPQGFSMTHYARDTTPIIGRALLDPDFNHDSLGQEGSGTDIIYYQFPTPAQGKYKAIVTAWYQVLPKKWVHDLGDDHELFRRFTALYESAEEKSVAIVSDSITSISLANEKGIEPMISLYPSLLTQSRIIHVETPWTEGTQLSLFDMNGNHVFHCNVHSGVPIQLPRELSPGLYIASISHNQQRVLKWVAIQ